MQRRPPVIVSVVRIYAVEELGIAGQAQPGLDLYIQLRTDIIGIVCIGPHPEVSVLMIVAPADHILDIFGAPTDVDIHILRRTRIVIEPVVPIEIGQINITQAAIPHLGQDPGAVGMLRLVIPPLPEPLIVKIRIAGVGCTIAGRNEHIGHIGAIIAAGFEVRRRRIGRERGPVGGGYLGRFLGAAALGRHENDTESAARTVNGGRRGVFEDRNAFDIIGIDPLQISFYAIHQNQRTAAVRRRVATDIIGAGGIRGAGALGNVEVRNHALKRLAHIHHRPVLELFGSHGSDGAREVDLLLYPVADHDDFFQLLGVFLHHDVDLFPAGNGLFDGLEADTFINQDGAGGHAD